MSETESPKDWRYSAYLRKENWPEAIPGMGPEREYGPFPWGEVDHDPSDKDKYPHTHPAAGSIGTEYLGDVCPWCGVPLSWSEEVVLQSGERGVFHDLNELSNPVPAYHPQCYMKRRGEGSEELESFA